MYGRIAEESLRLEHRHSDGTWGRFERTHHDAADHDPERDWAKGQIVYSCTTLRRAGPGQTSQARSPAGTRPASRLPAAACERQPAGDEQAEDDEAGDDRHRIDARWRPHRGPVRRSGTGTAPRRHRRRRPIRSARPWASRRTVRRNRLAVGDGVGERAGVAVGTGVGAAVGLTVGRAVGRAVGFAVGLGVGLAVGFGVDEDPALTTIVPTICSGWIWQK